MRHPVRSIGAVVLLLSVGSATSGIATPVVPRSDRDNETAVRHVYDQFTGAWNRHDVPAMARLWVEDGDHIEPDGTLAKGRRAIEALLKNQHAGPFRKSRLELHLDSVWFITGEVALVDSTYQVEGARNQTGQELGPRRGRLTSVFLKEDGGWWIAASRLMVPVALPYQSR